MMRISLFGQLVLKASSQGCNMSKFSDRHSYNVMHVIIYYFKQLLPNPLFVIL
jgi:hypothetical protein